MMNWQDNDFLFEDKNLEGACKLDRMSSTSTNIDENEKKNLIQFKKFVDPAKDPHRRSLINTVENFSRLLEKNQREEIDKTVMSEDCLVFVMNYEKDTAIRYSSKIGEGMSKIYPDVKIVERQVLENYVDVQRNTVIQICKCLIWQKEENSEEGSIVQRITCDLFSIKDHKISKYRVFFCTVDQSQSNPFAVTNKDRMLMRIKELNYTLCGLPDIEKVAALFDEETEYKICSWDQQNCYTSNKHELKEIFNQLQETMKIIKIIPYDFSASGCKVQANYVYYLQDKKDGKQYMWLTNCVYLFDEELKITKVLQMGELVDEATEITFEAFSLEEFYEQVQGLVEKKSPSLDIFFGNMIKLGCTYCTFGSDSDSNRLGKVERLDKLIHRASQSNLGDSHWRKVVDLYSDQHGSGYENFFFICCEEYRNDGSEVKEGAEFKNVLRINKLSLDNGKTCKAINFYIEVYEPIPSLFDDLEISAQNIVAAKSFYGL